jgi:hypothetical protein
LSPISHQLSHPSPNRCNRYIQVIFFFFCPGWILGQIRSKKWIVFATLPRTPAPQEKAAYGTSPCMGVNLGVEAEGFIRVGDPVFVIMGELAAN